MGRAGRVRVGEGEGSVFIATSVQTAMHLTGPDNVFCKTYQGSYLTTVGEPEAFAAPE
jgi:hypothetical protein